MSEAMHDKKSDAQKAVIIFTSAIADKLEIAAPSRDNEKLNLAVRRLHELLGLDEAGLAELIGSERLQRLKAAMEKHMPYIEGGA